MSTGALVRRAARGSTALRGGRVRRLTPYQVFGLLFWLVMTLAYWRVPPCCEAGLHAAAVEGLRSGLTDAAVSPYVLAQGVLARLTGLSGWQLLRVCGPLNLLVLLTGLGRLVRVLTPRPWAPVLALVLMSVLWGTRPGWGGGSPALLPLTGGLGYPSAFAFGLTLWCWALTGARARDLRRVRYVGPSGLRSLSGYAALGVLYGVVALVDPLLGAAAAAGAVAFVAGWQRGWAGAVRGRWGLMGAVAAAVFAVGTHARVLPQTYPVDGLYGGVAGQCWLAVLLGLPALWLRARDTAWRDPLVLLFVLAALPAGYGVRHGTGELLGAALLAPQCALAVELAAGRPWPVRRRVLGWATAGGVCLGFLTAQAGAVVPRSLDPVGFVQPPRWPSYDWAARHIGPGEPVVTDAYYAVHLLPGYGIRLADARDHRSRVRWLLLTRRERLPGDAVVVDWSRRTGEVLARLTGTQDAPAAAGPATRR
ncbi:hypothetical protein QZN11_29680 [Streptomyces gramineus]|uniref:hypothetical protein n=1 Tax=Streptomyces gramineus TaxID=910542 RepID=UPI00398B5DE4